MKTLNYDGSTFKAGPRGRPWRAAAWLLAVLCPALLAADYRMEIIELHSSLPADLIPILTPLAGADGSVIAANNALIVRASPARLADIHRVLATLDRPARNLMIQVRQSDHSQSSGGGGGGSVWVSGNGRIQGQVGAGAGTRTETRNLTQEVRTLDGRSAFISIGQDQPVAYRQLNYSPGGTVVQEGIDYRSSESGFYVVPRVQGDRVTLEISTRADSPGAQGSRETSAVEAQVQGRLGDWLPVGLSNERESNRSGGTLYYGQGQRSRQASVELRVVPLD
ncbi:secretin N-terminal domain-containing protein [uncultured Thiodictyon sp.]|uniref:secretin N-terminal domain-containing protein n=1 Tax=uncultured Thiodictyon sp. TaxID=1846217 RepID=UPI0025D39EF7|nr:secretin N-terminal domain-containing protein [uncultured Thiodictyon sp.]